MSVRNPFIVTALEFVERETGLTRFDLFSKRRTADVVWARTLLVWLLREHRPGSMSYPKIASLLNGRDHATIIHAHKVTAPRLREADPSFDEACAKFVAQLEQEREAA
ncbi:helix-turn-helix domain-containing protein [Citromicrobium bathyomarinum]|tara:strand:- start:4694 stop:5017 length:324 start_codon:yes stop_codon:yes gene_type:complete